MKYFFSCILFSGIILSHAQNDSLIKSFEHKKNQINRKGMITLTAWSGATIAGSTIGYCLNKDYDVQQFCLMNGAWGLINFSIALPGLVLKPKPSSSINELKEKQYKIEKIFLANAVLDIVYVGGGLALKEYANNQKEIKKFQQFNSYGNAVIIQGGALLIFDTAMTLINIQNRKKHLYPALENMQVSFGGNSIKIGYNFN